MVSFRITVFLSLVLGNHIHIGHKSHTHIGHTHITHTHWSHTYHTHAYWSQSPVGHRQITLE